MKTKLTLILMEVPNNIRTGIFNTNVVVDEDGNFPSIHVSTKDIDETLSNLCKFMVNVRYDWINPSLLDLFHKDLGTVEAVYTAVVEKGIIVCKEGYKLLPIEQAEVKDKYERAILSTPRAIYG
jgi:hypothetical protein